MLLQEHVLELSGPAFLLRSSRLPRSTLPRSINCYVLRVAMLVPSQPPQGSLVLAQVVLTF